MTTRNTLRALCLCLLVMGMSGGANAATLYSSNFDSATVGTLPTGWVTPVGSDLVTTTGMVSSPNAFGGGASGAISVYTGVAAQSNICIQDDQVSIHGGSVDSSQMIPILRCNPAGTMLYEASYNLATHVGQWYAVGPGFGGGAGYVAVGSAWTVPTFANGAAYTTKADISGSVLSVKFWAQGTSEPGSWTNQTTDSSNLITGTGYAGLFTNSNTTPLPAADNVFIGDAGTTFGASLTAGAATLTGLTGTSLTFAFTPATNGTGPYTYNVYRSVVEGTQGYLLASGVTSPYTNTGLATGQEYAYTFVATDSASATVNYVQTFGTPALPKLLVVDGNSLAAGYDNQDGKTFAQQMAAHLGLGWTVTDTAVSNTNTQDAITRYPGTVAPLYNLATYPGGCYIAYWELSNQICAGSGPTGTLAYLKQYIALAHATGYKVVNGDVISRNQPTAYAQFETDRTPINAALRAAVDNSYGDALADIAADSRFGPWGASANGTYYATGAGIDQQTHLVSYAIPADYFCNALSRVVYAPSAGSGAAAFITALHNDPQWRDIHAYTAGNTTYNATAKTESIYDVINGTAQGSPQIGFSLTIVNGVTTSRVRTL